MSVDLTKNSERGVEERPRPTARALPLPGLEQLWVMLALALIGVIIALVPTLPHDFWWHLKAGQLVAEQGVPGTNLFAWTLPADQPFVYATWLGEWLFYALYRLGGLGAPVLARNLLGLAGFALVAVAARRRSGSWRLAALAALLAGAMALNNLTTRTQNWAWVPFALYTLILGAYAGGSGRARTLLALPPLMAFWVNVHGSFVLGLALVALVGAGETLRSLLRQPGAANWARLRALYLAGGATLAAALLNPIGPRIFGYVAALTTNPTSQALVSEWQPPTPRGIAGTVFFASILALLAAFALARRRPSLTDVLLVCALLWLAWGGQRHVVWYGMAAMPILAQSLAQLSKKDHLSQSVAGSRQLVVSLPAADCRLPAESNRLVSQPVRAASRMALPRALLALLLLGALVAVQPPFKAMLGLPQPYRALFADVPGAPELFSRDTPVAATAYLWAHPIAGRLFNEMGYGSYLDWALYPDAQVFIDPRIELYPPALWQDYVAISEARDYDALLIEKYHVERVLLDRVLQPRLAAALAADTRWEREYADDRAEIYRLRK